MMFRVRVFGNSPHQRSFGFGIGKIKKSLFLSIDLYNIETIFSLTFGEK